ncbi:hypothetical protein ASPBRDRAFT_314790 [Aspergillus brasiliensis CBS 101740]|uniref:Uncharacterized protein n=1 Tax=Aspergillus brasiliensis (strain CBS 101740 / IMI 381727 / IBT 21946) TaxID=767769 RepID=A0A1L9UAT2_ASPBC|nr:hypothetical protein ASPBRDRAFT_314790 [Aspergillus brasiliensis CBS 101740]
MVTQVDSGKVQSKHYLCVNQHLYTFYAFRIRCSSNQICTYYHSRVGAAYAQAWSSCTLCCNGYTLLLLIYLRVYYSIYYDIIRRSFPRAR